MPDRTYCNVRDVLPISVLFHTVATTQHPHVVFEHLNVSNVTEELNF